MIDLNSGFGIFPKALDLHEKRAEILANNIANQDTPGFKARDIDFRKVLQESMKTAEYTDPNEMIKTNQSHFQDKNFVLNYLQYRNVSQPSLDGNTVDGQIEQAEFAENSMRYMANLQFLNNKIKGLLLAIKGS